MKKEIDVIIDAGLKAIVKDKIDAKIDYYNLDNLTKEVIADKYTNQLTQLDVSKIIEPIDSKELLKRLDTNNQYGENKLNKILERALEQLIYKLLEEEFNLYWHESRDIVKTIIGDEELEKDFISKMKNFITNFINKK